MLAPATLGLRVRTLSNCGRDRSQGVVLYLTRFSIFLSGSAGLAAYVVALYLLRDLTRGRPARSGVPARIRRGSAA